MSREIEVWAGWHELGEPQLMGALRASPSRGKEVFSFNYDPKWLEHNASRQLDPDLALVEGPQFSTPTRGRTLVCFWIRPPTAGDAY